MFNSRTAQSCSQLLFTYGIYYGRRRNAIIFYRCNLFLFLFRQHGISTKLGQYGSGVFYKCLTKRSGSGWASPKIWGEKTSTFGPLFPQLSHSTLHISGMKRRMDKQKCYCQSTMCPLQVDLLSVTFDPETAEIRLLIITQHLVAIT